MGFISAALIRPSSDYNIICHHMRFTDRIFQHLYRTSSAKRNLKKITILRSPESLFYSSFNYFKQEYKGFREAQTPERFLAYPERFYNRSDFVSQFGHNHLFFDFGYDADIKDPKLIRHGINHMDKVFDLVMIQDYFDESLILLKELLN